MVAQDILHVNRFPEAVARVVSRIISECANLIRQRTVPSSRARFVLSVNKVLINGACAMAATQKSFSVVVPKAFSSVPLISCDTHKH